MKTDRDKHGLRGPVETVVVEIGQLEERDGQVTEKPQFGYTMTFNRDGWLTEQTQRNPDGGELRSVCDYSDSGRLLAMRSYLSSGARVDEMNYIYDDEGRLVAEQHTTADGKVTTPSTYVYNAGGEKTKIQEFDFAEEAGVMFGAEETNTTFMANGAKRIETRYDERNEAIEVKAFDAAGMLITRVEITRDAQGKSLEETQYIGEVAFGPCNSDSCSIEEMQSLTEEEKAELTAEVAQLFSPGTAMSKHTHQYDTEGRLVESKLTMMGIVASHQTFAYDEAGNKSEEVNYGADATSGGKTIFTRDYDEHGNWTKELLSTVSPWDAEFGLSRPAHVTRRKITYYP